MPSLKDIADKKLILADARKQRIVWARLTTIKRILIRASLTTHEEFEELASAMVRDIDRRVLESLAAELGAEEG